MRSGRIAVLSACALAFALGGSALAGGSEKGKAMASDKAAAKQDWYMLTGSHTVEQCQASMKEMGTIPADAWKNYYAGCMHGDHTSFMLVQAESSDAAKMMVPAAVRDGVRAVQVDKLSMEMSKAAHAHDKESK